MNYPRMNLTHWERYLSECLTTLQQAKGSDRIAAKQDLGCCILLMQEHLDVENRIAILKPRGISGFQAHEYKQFYLASLRKHVSEQPHEGERHE